MSSVSGGTGESAPKKSMVDSGVAMYVLGLVTFAYALAYVDRQMLNLLVDPIKTSLDISDTRFSLIQGAAFVVAYLAAAPVFGRLVDVTSRRNILIFGVIAWSLFTAACGYAHDFWSLFIARFGVGIAEACVFPVGISLIADYFSPKRTPFALSVFTLASTLGGGFSLVASGLVIAFAEHLRLAIPNLNSLETWQMAFVVIGLPGIAFSLILLTIPEPRRHIAETAAEKEMSMKEVGDTLWKRIGFYGRIYGGIGMLAVVALGMTAWFPSFLIRAHGVAPADVGFRLGVVAVLCGTVGCLTGPLVARWFDRKGYKDSTLRATAFGMLVLVAAALLIPYMPSATSALALAGVLYFFASFPTGVVAAATAAATPNRMRGVVASLYTFAAQLVGYGVGPTAIAMITDNVFRDPQMVGYSMQIAMSIAAAVGAFLFFTVLKPYRALISDR